MVKAIEMELKGTVVIVHPAKEREMEAKGWKHRGKPVARAKVAKPEPIINKPSDEE